MRPVTNSGANSGFSWAVKQMENFYTRSYDQFGFHKTTGIFCYSILFFLLNLSRWWFLGDFTTNGTGMQHAADEYTRTTTKSVVRKYYEMRLKNSNDYQSRQQPPAVMQKELESKIFCLQMIIAENIRCMELLLKSSPQTHTLPPAPGYDQMLTLAALRDSSSISAFMAASDTSTFSDVSDSVPIKPFHNCYKDKDTPPYSSASKPPPPPPPPPSDSKPDFKYDPEYALFLKWRQEHEIRSERKRGKQPTNDVELPDGTTNPEYSPCSDTSDDEHDSPPKPDSLPDSSSSSSSSSGSSEFC